VAATFGWVTCRRIGLPVAEFGRGVVRVGLLVLPMAVVVYLLRIWLVSVGVPAGPRLVLLVLIGSGFYLAIVRWRAPDLLEESKRMLLPRIRSAIPSRERVRKAGRAARARSGPAA
jgi:hypothetical protein